MHLVVWLALCLVGSWLCRRRPIILVVAVLLIWAAVPGVAAAVVTGHATGKLSMHPATWLVFIALGVLALENPHAVSEVLGRHALVLLNVGLVVSVGVWVTKFGASPTGLVLLVDQIAAPVMLFFLAKLAFAQNRASLLTVRNVLLIIAAVQSVLCVVQKLTKTTVFYTHYYEQQYWYDPTRFNRWMGTLDHPLVLGMALAVCIPLVAGLRSAGLQALLIALFLVGILVTESRSSLVAGALAAIYVVFSGELSAARRAVVGLALGSAVVYAASSALSSGVTARFNNDTGSAGARGAAFSYFFEHMNTWLLFGQGFTSNYAVAANAGLQTSFENSFVMYSIDLGVIFAVLYFGTIVALSLASVGQPNLRGLTFAAIICLALPQTFTSLGADTFVGPLVWIVLALTSSPTPGTGHTHLNSAATEPARQENRVPLG